jgi:hypothetical protein
MSLKSYEANASGCQIAVGWLYATHNNTGIREFSDYGFEGIKDPFVDNLTLLPGKSQIDVNTICCRQNVCCEAYHSYLGRILKQK